MNTNARREFLGLTLKRATMGATTGFVGAADTADMVMWQEENSLKELETLQKIVPFAPFREIKTLHPFDLNAYYSALEEKSIATSYGMGWKELQAVRMESPGGEFSAVITPSMHVLVLSVRPPEKIDLRYEGVKRELPPPAGSIAVVPAGSSVLSRLQGSNDSLLIYLEPSLVTRVAADSFELDPSRTVVRPLVGLNVPELRSAMLAVDAELKAGSVGGSLMVESLANVLAVHLIRHITGAHRLPASADGELPRRKLRTVIEYIMENLGGNPTLGQMAAVVHLSPYHFARQFKASTGLPPRQYVIARRVERAQHLLRADGELGLVDVALRAGFSDQSKFSFHFKRIVGVTPGQFRISARKAQKSASLGKNSDAHSVAYS
jgi:AraC family transcriptional regulator